MENIENYVDTLCDQYNIRVELSLENLILYGYKNVTWGYKNIGFLQVYGRTHMNSKFLHV